MRSGAARLLPVHEDMLALGSISPVSHCMQHREQAGPGISINVCAISCYAGNKVALRFPQPCKPLHATLELGRRAPRSRWARRDPAGRCGRTR